MDDIKKTESAVLRLETLFPSSGIRKQIEDRDMGDSLLDAAVTEDRTTLLLRLHEAGYDVRAPYTKHLDAEMDRIDTLIEKISPDEAVAVLQNSIVDLVLYPRSPVAITLRRQIEVHATPESE